MTRLIQLTRVAWRGFVIFSSLFLCIGVVWAGVLVLFPWPKAATAYKDFWFYTIEDRIILKFSGLRIETNEPIPKGIRFLVVNHTSVFDTLVFLRFVKGHFVYKKELRKIPLINLILTTLGHICLDRSSNKHLNTTIGKITNKLNANRSIILFGEGHRSEGKNVKPIRASLLEPCIQQNIPVHYAVLKYSSLDEKAVKTSELAWVGRSNFFQVYSKMVRAKAIKVAVRFGQKPILESNRKALSQRLHEEMNSLLSSIP